jgi:hypothetical protein
MNETVTSH